MKKVVSSFPAAAAFAVSFAFSLQGALAQAAASGQVQMDPAEYQVYNAAIQTTDPTAQAAALDAYLTKYPNSSVKNDVLERIMIDYSKTDPAKTLTAADKVLQVAPNDFTALLIEAVLRNQQATTTTDAAGKQSAMDQAAGYAQKALDAPKPASADQAQFDTTKKNATPTLYSTIGADDLGKKDYAGAIAAYKSELGSVDVAATQAVGTPLQDTYLLGQAYYSSTPPDYVNCTFYTTRAAQYAPEPYKSQFTPLATYCYKRYHGGTDGYDAVVAAAKANLNPPSGFTIVAAPSDADIAAKTVASTSDLATLALSDKEFILANGKQEDADKVWGVLKGKEVEVPNGVVIASTADQVQVAVSDDAVQGKTADFTFNMKTPLTKVPAVGEKVTLIGTYASYTQKPLMIMMSDASTATAAKKPAPRRR